MKKYAIYSVLGSGTDTVSQPLVIDGRFDYILFADAEGEYGVWQFRKNPCRSDNPLIRSRYPKMHPEELLQEYEATLYVDADIQITSFSFYNRIFEALIYGYEWAGVCHPGCDCTFDEAYNVMAYELSGDADVIRWCCTMRKDRFPRYYGLYDGSIILRVNNDRVLAIDRLWWNNFTASHTSDSLSLMYTLWRGEHIRRGYLLPRGESALDSDSLRLTGRDDNFCRSRKLKRRQFYLDLHYRAYYLPQGSARPVLTLCRLLATVDYFFTSFIPDSIISLVVRK